MLVFSVTKSESNQLNRRSTADHIHSFNPHPQPSPMPPKTAKKRKAPDVSPSAGGARLRQKVADKTKGPVQGAAPSEPSMQIAKINFNNKLHIPARKTHPDLGRIWYAFDIVEPAPRFRRMGQSYKGKEGPADVSEGENSDDLSDNPGEGKSPVSWFGYM